jgi:hypothetical protein
MMIGTLLELFWSCTKIGLLAFGGGHAAIPLLAAEAVPRWISEQEFGFACPVEAISRCPWSLDKEGVCSLLKGMIWVLWG